MRIHISNGNAKMGQIPNTSFPPGITCRPDAPCLTDGCYALKFYRMYKSCRTAWDDNWDFYNEDRMGYWSELRQVIATTRYFRYFVSGDIPDEYYVEQMITAAEDFPNTDFLCFTKRFEIVNKVLEHRRLPENLHLILSTWEGFTPENPHGLSESAVITKGMEVPEDWKICGGNCTECACRGVGCWQLKRGETIAFHKH